MIIPDTFGQIDMKKNLKDVQLLPKIAKKNLKNIFSQISAILGDNYTVFIKSIVAILCQKQKNDQNW